MTAFATSYLTLSQDMSKFEQREGGFRRPRKSDSKHDGIMYCRRVQRGVIGSILRNLLIQASSEATASGRVDNGSPCCQALRPDWVRCLGVFLCSSELSCFASVASGSGRLLPSGKLVTPSTV